MAPNHIYAVVVIVYHVSEIYVDDTPFTFLKCLSHTKIAKANMMWASLTLLCWYWHQLLAATGTQKCLAVLHAFFFFLLASQYLHWYCCHLTRTHDTEINSTCPAQQWECVTAVSWKSKLYINSWQCIGSWSCKEPEGILSFSLVFDRLGI